MLSEGFMVPTLAHRDRSYQVALVGEALGKEEADAGSPFQGRAGFKLTRLIEWAGLDRSMFDIWNTVWCRPPDNKLEGQAYEEGAVNHCRRHWDHLLDRVRVVVPMGNVPLHAFTGRKGIIKTRGYVEPGPGSTYLLPTVHPSFIARGQSKYAAAFIHDLQRAVELGRDGLPVERVDYTLDPSPRVAYEWARRYLDALNADDRIRLSFDIETPGKGDDEGALDDGEDRTYFIWRIGFAYGPGLAISFPWEAPYIPAARLLLGSSGDKVVWNADFDVPRIRAAGVPIEGVIHDGMVAWHILHSDLPKGLGFVATFTCPSQPRWKHLSHAQPAYYNAIDADVEWRSMEVIERELKKIGLWDVYRRDVLDLAPILIHMTKVGMPLDPEIRYDRATRLARLQAGVLKKVEDLIPQSLRSVEPKQGFVKDPKVTDGLVKIRVITDRVLCNVCGKVSPARSHFRAVDSSPRYGKRGQLLQPRKPNPCAQGTAVIQPIEVERWARVAPLKLSSKLLIRYNDALGRATPTKKDKSTGVRKPTMDEKAIKECMRKYQVDELYPLVLEYRELDKIAGTYIGRPYGPEDQA